jgi:hypothetical protein
MRHGNMDDLPAYPPVLDAGLVTQIHGLNRDYIDLLGHRSADADGPFSLHLPEAVVAALAQLDDEQRSALARTSYSLYSLGFEHSSFWRTAATDALPASSRYGASISHAYSAFCEVALFHAWHSAVSNPLAARVVYGMPDAVLERLSDTPPRLVKRLAAEHVHMLLPRWPSNPRFWPDLVRFAADRDARRLTAAQLLGNQLLAADFERAQRCTRAG